MAQTARKQLPNLPSMPKGRAISNWAKCRCGCGGNTQSTFVPGHDARLRGLMLRTLRGIMTLEQVEEWGGIGTRKAVESALRDANIIARWNLQPEIEAAKEREEAERLAAEEQSEAADEADADDDTDDDDEADEAEGDEATE
jgi:hypothetical protein